MTPRRIPLAQASIEVGAEQEAVLILMGGRVEYINPAAQALFGLQENETPDLEHLARRARPSEDFIDLCALPGEKHLTVNSRRVEAHSYTLPLFAAVTFVRFHPLDIVGDTGEASLFKAILDFTQQIGGSLDVQESLQTVAYHLAHFFPFDFLEIRLWDAAREEWTLYTFDEGENYVPRLVPSGVSRFGERYLGLPPDHPVLLSSHSKSPGEATALHSYLGVVLNVGEEKVGVLEMGAQEAEKFGEKDVPLLSMLKTPISIALRNALKYQQAQRRLDELSGPVNLSQAIGTAREPQEVFSRLVENLRRLFPVEILGFLLYDAERHLLYAQKPFYGLPENIIEIYHSVIPVGSRGEAVLGQHEILFTAQPGSDPIWVALGLHTFALAAGLREAILAPLVVGDEFAGYLQIANHVAGFTPFSDDEKRLLNALLPQLSSIVKNALLVQQARQRLQRTEALRRIAHLVVSEAPLDDVLKYVLQELGRLFQADFGAVYLLDEERGRLRLHAPSLWNVSPQQAAYLEELYLGEEYYRTISGAQRPFLSGNLSRDERVLPLYRGIVERFRIESSMVVPLLVRGRSRGELMLGHRAASAFRREDLQVMLTAASLVATAIESHRLSGVTDEVLRRRLEIFSAIARITRELHVTLDVERVMKVIHGESLRLLKADCGSIYLFAEDDVGELVPRVERIFGESKALLPHEVEAIRERRSLRLDFSKNSDRPHQDVSSVLVAPILHGEKVLGLIDLHSHQPHFFADDESRQALEMLAVQAGIALANARAYAQELQQAALFRVRAQALQELEALNRRVRADSSLEDVLNEVAVSITRASPFDAVLISIYQPEDKMLRRVTGVGIAPETMRELLLRRQPWSALQTLLRPEFRLEQAYFIPAEQLPVIPPEVHAVTLDASSPAKMQANAWKPDDLLLFPLTDAQGQPVGLLSVDRPRDGRRPDRVTIEVIQAFAAQAMQWILHFRQLEEAKREAERTQIALQRQQMLLSVAQGQVPLLLHSDLEHVLALHTLEGRIRRIRAFLNITEVVSRQVDVASALMSLGREVLTRLEMSVVLVAESTSEGPVLRHVLGSVPADVHVETLFGQRNPLRVALQSGEQILVSNVEESDEWRDVPLLEALRAKGFLCFSLVVENVPMAAVLAVSTQPLPPFTEEDRQFYAQVARQVAIILQNISLLTQTRRRLQEVNLLLEFSRRIAGAGPVEILEILLNNVRQVITAAHAGVVLLWNERERVLQPVVAEGYMDSKAMLNLRYRSGEALPGQVFESRRPRRVGDVNFTRDYPLSADQLLLYRQAAGQRLPVSSLLVPIQSANTTLGVVVLDNFNQPQAFSPADEALVLSLTQQVTLFMENMRLVQAAQERALQMEALSSATTELAAHLSREDIIATLLDRLRTILPYDAATLWLRDDERMRVVAARGFPDTEERLGLSLVIRESALLQEMIRTGLPLTVDDVRNDPRFPPVEVARLSWLGLPLMVKGEMVGVITLEKWEAHFYTYEKVQIGMTFAGQAAIALENARLFEESLQRATELDERSKRLSLLNRLSAALAATLDADEILRLTARELFEALNGDFLSTITLDDGQPRLHSVFPFMRLTSSALAPSPLFQGFLEGRGVFVTEQALQEPDLRPLLPAWREEMPYLLALPLISGENLRAVYLIQRVRAPFTSAEIELARTMANQTAIALENARLYQSTLRTAERFATLNRVSAEIGAKLNLEELAATVQRATLQLFPLDAFVFALADEAEKAVDVVYLFDKGEVLPPMRLKWGQGISGRVIESGEAILMRTLEEVQALRAMPRGELPSSILAVPIRQGEKVVGALSIQSYRPYAYSEEDLQVFSTLSNQVGVALQNARLFQEAQSLAETLEQRVRERTTELEREKRNTETLLRIFSEVSATLDLDRALHRTLSLLNEAVGAEQGTIMLLNPEDFLLYYRAGYGYLADRQVDKNLPKKGFRIGEGLAGWVAAHREAVLVEDLTKDERWISYETSREHRSAVGVPLMVGENILGVLMVFHRQPGFFDQDSLNLIKAIAGQVSIALNNANLYQLIRDQSERLGNLYRQQAEEASRSQAILEAVADGVLVTDANNRISFLNRSAERILRLEAQRILGQPLESFAGLFGKAAREWINTIHYWSEEPSSYQPGESYVERIELDDGRVVLVHLAPVILQNDFLGTVSIFRDITHEVEVDRLKSEFVATVSHELRTPMTSIRGYVDLLLMGAAGALNEMQTNFLNVIKGNTDRLNALVADLLDISRIEAGRVTLTPQPLNLRQIAEESLAGIQRRAQQENKAMTFSLEAATSLPLALGDLERVRQILDNLLENAYSYTPAGGRVQIRLHAGDAEVQVDVQDSGIGIPPEEQARIFERFYRGEHPFVIQTPGTGLGLSIVKQLVEMHGGRIWVTSSGIYGEGSTFSFTLPIYKATAE
ncbi:MAG: GAF domain-containing protein [Anaerolineales bacterium]